MIHALNTRWILLCILLAIIVVGVLLLASSIHPEFHMLAKASVPHIMYGN
jgi:hypothetical protein